MSYSPMPLTTTITPWPIMPRHIPRRHFVDEDEDDEDNTNRTDNTDGPGSTDGINDADDADDADDEDDSDYVEDTDSEDYIKGDEVYANTPFQKKKNLHDISPGNRQNRNQISALDGSSQILSSREAEEFVLSFFPPYDGQDDGRSDNVDQQASITPATLPTIHNSSQEQSKFPIQPIQLTESIKPSTPDEGDISRSEQQQLLVKSLNQTLSWARIAQAQTARYEEKEKECNVLKAREANYLKTIWRLSGGVVVRNNDKDEQHSRSLNKFGDQIPRTEDEQIEEEHDNPYQRIRFKIEILLESIRLLRIRYGDV